MMWTPGHPPLPFPLPLKRAQGAHNRFGGIIIYNKPYDTNMCGPKRIGRIIVTSIGYSSLLLVGIIIYHKILT